MDQKEMTGLDELYKVWGEKRNQMILDRRSAAMASIAEHMGAITRNLQELRILENYRQFSGGAVDAESGSGTDRKDGLTEAEWDSLDGELV